MEGQEGATRFLQQCRWDRASKAKPVWEIPSWDQASFTAFPAALEAQGVTAALFSVLLAWTDTNIMKEICTATLCS